MQHWKLKNFLQSIANKAGESLRAYRKYTCFYYLPIFALQLYFIMKKIIPAVLVLLLLLAIAAFIPQTITHQVQIHSNVNRVAEQLLENTNIPKWMAPFAGMKKNELTINTGGSPAVQSANASASVQFSTPFTATVEINSDSKKKQFEYIFFPDDKQTSSSFARVSCKTTLLRKIFGLNGLEQSAKESISNLKNYMEDPIQFYGYDIQLTKVTDSAFLVTRSSAQKNEIAIKAGELFKKLIAFAEKNNAGFTGVKIFHKERVTENEYDLSAGIGVTKSFPATLASGFEYRMMPVGKNLLTLTYTGMYGEIHKAYEALEKFKKDNLLSSMAISFEKIDDNVKLDENEMVKIQIFYPVF